MGVFFGSCIINQNNTYAVEDLSYIIDSSNSNSLTYFCNDNDSTIPDCSGYSYFQISLNEFCPYSQTSLDFQYGYNYQPYGLQVRLYPSSFTFYYVPVFSSFFHRAFSLSSGCEISVLVSENNPFGGSSPSGSIELTENGTYDVSQYAEAVVNVPETDCPPSSGGGNYHEDLVAINNSILICAAVCLVIYFFYCIYRMIIKNSGVK